ncbi:MAG TPA: UDP-glucose/GDP-mannose dehydrogenase family protein [Patescibacteria group bacterium]|nr:UDP-glucose/GDP-mannose dehydrogenase family protein [Patescibacteria group bacterium]
MKIGIIGTGYVGLVTGTCLSDIGHNVVCLDIDKSKITLLNSGQSPIYEPGLVDLIHKNQETGRLKFTTELSDVEQSEVIFFALPTPPGEDGHADLSYVLSAAGAVAEILTKYTVLVNKSTVPVGTARKVHEAVASKTDIEFDVVSNPEFLREGLAINDFMNADRIVIGTSSDRARNIMEKLYQPLVLESVPLLVMDEASSEMSKYAANSFLATKISFMNDIANLCELVGANVDMVREGIGTDERIGSRFLNAGIGYGGSCFPKDALALQKVALDNNYDLKILAAAIEVNIQQKKVLTKKVVRHMGEDLSGKTFAIWGLAFKPDTDDVRQAPALGIISELLERGAKIQAYDPEAMANMKLHLPDITYADDEYSVLDGADALLIVTEWKQFTAVEPKVLADRLREKLVFDGRNIFDPKLARTAGLVYYSIGRQ